MTLKRSILLLVIIWTAGLLLAAWGQTKIKPGVNMFSLEQDVELGRHASQEIEQQVSLLRDVETDQYVTNLGTRLARNSDRADFPWQFKTVNAPDVNAFALPGGFIYVNRGLIETAETEGQLAGVLSHEIAHVTLRHGTNQLTKASSTQLVLGALSGAVGDKGLIGKMTQLGMGVGANLAFMRFSRDAETQADVAGVQMMTRSGYDPQEMGRMFELLDRQRQREPIRFEQFFSSHPIPKNRVGRINQEIGLVGARGSGIRTTPQFAQVATRLRSMPPPPRPVQRQQPSRR